MTEKKLLELREKLREKRWLDKAIKESASKIAEIFMPEGESKDERADKAEA